MPTGQLVSDTSRLLGVPKTAHQRVVRKRETDDLAFRVHWPRVGTRGRFTPETGHSPHLSYTDWYSPKADVR